jgi:hypothetical protein
MTQASNAETVLNATQTTENIFRGPSWSCRQLPEPDPHFVTNVPRFPQSAGVRAAAAFPAGQPELETLRRTVLTRPSMITRWIAGRIWTKNRPWMNARWVAGSRRARWVAELAIVIRCSHLFRTLIRLLGHRPPMQTFNDFP